MASFHQPTAHPSLADTQSQPQDSSSYSYDHTQLQDPHYCADAAQPWEHTASSPDSEVYAEHSYAYYHTLLRFEEGLANDYLAIPPIHPPNVDCATADIHGLPYPNPGSYPSSVLSEGVYSQWYTDSTTASPPPMVNDYEGAYYPYAAPTTALGPIVGSTAQAPQAYDSPPMAATPSSIVISTYSALADAYLGYPRTVAQSAFPVAAPMQYSEGTSGGETTAQQYRTYQIAHIAADASPSCLEPNVTPAAEPPSSPSRVTSHPVEVAISLSGTPPLSNSEPRQRTSHRARNITVPSFPHPTPATPSASCDTSLDSTKLVPTPRRNATVPADARGPASARANRWECPHCNYVQSNKRTPDLKRHLKTHEGETQEWVCCGVPLVDAGKHGVPMEVQLGAPFEYDGSFMVGGCRKTFSRKDALARHLRTYKGVCFGEVTAPYIPGNKAEGGDD